AGQPIYLALPDLSTDHLGNLTVTMGEIPSGWTLSEGINNGDGTWTLQTMNVGSLTITTLPSFVGAAVVKVTEAWTHVDGTMGTGDRRLYGRALAPGVAHLGLAG